VKEILLLIKVAALTNVLGVTLFPRFSLVLKPEKTTAFINTL
jgi:hypothetical protein